MFFGWVVAATSFKHQLPFLLMLFRLSSIIDLIVSIARLVCVGLDHFGFDWMGPQIGWLEWMDLWIGVCIDPLIRLPLKRPLFLLEIHRTFG